MIERMKFHDPVPMQLFSEVPSKWSSSQGNHMVLAETSMLHLNVLHIKQVIHISTNTDNGGKSIVQVYCVCMGYGGSGNNTGDKNNFKQTVLFSNSLCPLPCSQDSSSLHHTTGCFCRITRLQLTYMEMLCENKKLPLPSCPLYAPVCTWASVCVRACACVHMCTCMPECVFLHACPLCAPRFCVQRELLALMFSDAGNCWYPY